MLAGAAALLGMVGTALASTPTQNVLTVSGPYAVGFNAPYKLTIKGYAYKPTGANYVAAWRTKAVCQTGGSTPAKAYADEVAKHGAPAWSENLPGGGAFDHSLSYVGATQTGQTVYYWCGYLVKKTNSGTTTLKVKGWKYSELGQGGGPGGP